MLVPRVISTLFPHCIPTHMLLQGLKLLDEDDYFSSKEYYCWLGLLGQCSGTVSLNSLEHYRRRTRPESSHLVLWVRPLCGFFQPDRGHLTSGPLSHPKAHKDLREQPAKSNAQTCQHKLAGSYFYAPHVSTIRNAICLPFFPLNIFTAVWANCFSLLRTTALTKTSSFN